MPSIVFRKLGLGTPAEGELWIRPAPAPTGTGAPDRSRPAVARAVYERGLDALRKGDGPVQVIVVDAEGVKPTFDEMLAALFAQHLLEGKPLPPAFEAFARYAPMLRQGILPTDLPAEETIEGIYLAIRNRAGLDLTDPAVAARFLEGWDRLARRLLRAAAENTDIFHQSLFKEGHEFAEEKADLRRDRDRYRRDVKHGERWKVLLPGTDHPEAGLYLKQPKSYLFASWSRRDRRTPTGDPYLFLAVCWGGGEWTFSTDPAHKELKLKSLAVVLQGAENLWQKGDTAAMGPVKGGLLGWLRPAQAPRPARVMASSMLESLSALPGSGAEGVPLWYDGRDHDSTIVATPYGGTKLPDERVLELVKRWADARKYVPPRRLPQWLTPAALAAAVVLVGCLAVLLATFGWLWVPDWEKVYSKVAPAVVIVEAPPERGTGFFITPEGATAEQGWLITNSHVIAPLRPDPQTGLRRATVRLGKLVDGRMEPLGDGVPALVFKDDSGKDLALLRLEDKPEGVGSLLTLPLARSTKIKGGLPCLAIGHPLVGRLWMHQPGHIIQEANWPEDEPETILGIAAAKTEEDRKKVKAELKQLLREEKKILLSNCDLGSGFSGGPLINKDGQVIGVSYSVTKAQPDEVIPKLTYHIHLEELTEFLKTIPVAASEYRPGLPEDWAKDPDLEPIPEVSPQGFYASVSFKEKEGKKRAGLWLDVRRKNRNRDPQVVVQKVQSGQWPFQFALRFRERDRFPTAYYDTDGQDGIDLIVQSPGRTKDGLPLPPDVEWRLMDGRWKPSPPVDCCRPLLAPEWFTDPELGTSFTEDDVITLKAAVIADAKVQNK